MPPKKRISEKGVKAPGKRRMRNSYSLLKQCVPPFSLTEVHTTNVRLVSDFWSRINLVCGLHYQKARDSNLGLRQTLFLQCYEVSITTKNTRALGAGTCAQAPKLEEDKVGFPDRE